ncbi:SOUL family heme-binding protein [Halogeometricum limi]|uniref:SOUL heme-binding protein n=1 Tax=Halogeometricum limi TaxID=555875 RepID=A0A1I6ILK9_9EURY|nr:heme-binding protein [Halogeometricum limi]SFR67608.1 SOUL heme-binding protein [Halogeometricum limi]
MKRAAKLLLGGVGVALAAWTAWGVYSSRSAERVPYETVRSIGEVEIRRYPRTLLVETTAADTNAAFRRLFAYISGENERAESVSMTAPVRSDGTARNGERGGRELSTAASARADDGQKVSMTAPVRTDEDRGGVRMAFYLPAEYTLETAPVPTNSDVRLVVEGARTTAVKAFSWWATDRRVADAEASLLATLEREGVETHDEPSLLQYNDPYTPPYMQRHEVAVTVAVDA